MVATLNSLDGRIKGNAAIVPAGYLGEINVYVTNTTDVVLDIDGYFAPVSGSTLAFYPLFPPCRVADTRKPDFPPGLGTPHLSGLAQRDFAVLSSPCGIPGTGAGVFAKLNRRTLSIRFRERVGVSGAVAEGPEAREPGFDAE